MTSEAKESKILIRRARPDDYDDIIAIGDVYAGRDYLAAEFSGVLKEPDIMYPLVAEVDGKAVGFYFNHIIDGGRTVLKRAGRVHNSYRGQGIFHKLSEALDEQRKKAWPNVQYEGFGASERVVKRAEQEFQEKGFVKLVKKQILNMVFRQSDFQGKEQLSDFDHIKRMTRSDLKLLFGNKAKVDKLFPNGVIFNFFIGYRPMEANIRYLDNDDTGMEVYATTFSSPSTTTPLSSESSSRRQDVQNFAPEVIKDIDIVSCVYRYRALLGLAYALDLYTADGYSESVLVEHIKKHIYKFRECSKEDGYFMVTFNSNVNRDNVLACLKEHGIVDFIPGLDETYKVFYEKKLT